MHTVKRPFENTVVVCYKVNYHLDAECILLKNLKCGTSVSLLSRQVFGGSAQLCFAAVTILLERADLSKADALSL